MGQPAARACPRHLDIDLAAARAASAAEGQRARGWHRPGQGDALKRLIVVLRRVPGRDCLFFQTSRTNIVIFEDLDRFKDPHIFETLRELNLLLNNASQTGDENIRFVYAIRDSIFEQLSRASEDNPDRVSQPPAPLTPAEVAAARRLVTTNRTKFFDLVVPMVPFISHRTSRDLIKKELASVPKAQRPGEQLVELVSAHITDMRLIKNVCNEYDVFRTRILRESGLKELTPDKLFASVVYKNQYLLDYEAIRHGDSLLDKLYQAYRDWATESAANARRVERVEGARLRRLDAISSRSKRLGKRLQDVLLAREQNNVNTTQFTVTTSATQFSFDDLQTSRFWRTFLNNQDDLAVVYQRNYSMISANLAFAKVQTLLGEDLDIADWEEADRSELVENIGRATKDQRRFAHATLREAMRATSDLFTYEGEEQSLEAVAKELFPEADLVIDLIRTGYIDENFTLYVTQFPDNSRAAAMNFIIRAVQPNRMDVDFHFGATDEVSTDDIQAALDGEGSRILDGRSVFNREIFDYLLGKSPESLHAPIRRLAASAEDEEHRKFIDAYVGGGKHAKEFIALLGQNWSGAFGFLFADDPEAVDPVLLSALLDGADPRRDYVLQDEERRVLQTLLPKLEAVTKRRSAKVSRAIATVLRKLGVSFDDLSVAADQLAECVIADSNYAVSRHNLEVIMGSAQKISLDRVKSEGPDGVYTNLLEHLSKYLEALTEDPTIPTVAQQDGFVEALNDVHDADPDSLAGVATAAGHGITVKSTNDINEAMWRSVMAAGRLALTASNVSAYMDGPGIDSALVAALEAEKTIEVDEDATKLDKLALRLVNSEDISTATKLSLLDSLHLQAGSLDADEIDVTAHALIPELVRRGEIADDAFAFNALQENDRVNKPALANVSKTFIGYMDSLTLTANELYDLVAPASSDAIKEHVIANMGVFRNTLGQNGAASLIKWAAAKSRAVDAETLGILIAKSEHRAANEAIALIAPKVNEIELQELGGMLHSFGGSYAQLANPGRDRPRVPKVEGMDALLGRLKDAGIVSKYAEKSGEYRVSKHHA